MAAPSTKSQMFAAGWFAMGSAALALGISGGLRPDFGSVIERLLIPFVIALVAWAFVGVLRLALVGFLPGGFYQAFGANAGPWTRAWLVARFGLLFGGLILIAAIIVAAVAGVGISYCFNALVYLLAVRMFLDLVAGALFNAGIIRTRRSH